MAFSSTSQLHPTSLHSISKLHSFPLPFLLRSPSCSSFSSIPYKQLPLSNSTTLVPKPQPTHHSRWIDKWKHTQFPKLPKKPRAIVDYRGNAVSDDDEDVVGTSRSTGSSTMEKIVEKLKRYGYIDDLEERKERSLPEKGSVEDIFYAEDGVLPNSRGGLEGDFGEEVKFPWEKVGEDGGKRTERKKVSKSSVAELTLPEGELRRLRHLAIRTKSKTKIGGAGVTKEIVDKILEKWNTDEVVRLKCEGPPALNMKRMHEILERKTGGLVIWRSGSSISLYRGVSYEIPQPVKKQDSHFSKLGFTNRNTYKSKNSPAENYSNISSETLQEGDPSYDKNNSDTMSPAVLKYEHEMDKLLDGLGPRCTDWSGCDPLPVDADLLPGFVPGYKPPFRILPYGTRPNLGIKDQTALRRLARSLPPHFALGRSRQHQGLASAMVKLWEKSSIAKIALKRGVQLTTSERMAEDIKKLTGGVLLCRNKDYIVFYRGKDFLVPELTEALLERERLAKALQDEEEHARTKASLLVFPNTLAVDEYGTTGTLTETQEADAKWGKKLDNNHKDKMLRAADVERHGNLMRKLERKLYLAEKRVAKAERALGKVEEFLKPAEHRPDPESISDEERFMFRKLGLKMKAFLLLGRRGVFDGTVENMHLHWKYRELVKIIVKAKTFAQVKNVALSLEAESGGVLVSVDKVSKGFAVVVYRGRDYQRPRTLRPSNLLTKRKALARSIELQRQEALLRHVSNMRKRIEKLKAEIGQMEAVREHGDEELYSKLDSTYLSEDDETEDESDDAYLETFDNTISDDIDGDDTDDDKDNDELGEEEDDEIYDEEDDDDKEDPFGNSDSVVTSVPLLTSNSDPSIVER